MHIDELFDMSDFDESLYDKIKKKFDYIASSRRINNEDKEEMLQDWWVNTIRGVNRNFLKNQPYDYYKKKHYKNEYVSDHSGTLFDTHIDFTKNTESYMLLSDFCETILRNFGERIASMYFDYMKGYYAKELTAKYGVSDRTIHRHVKEVREWVELNLK